MHRYTCVRCVSDFYYPLRTIVVMLVAAVIKRGRAEPYSRCCCSEPTGEGGANVCPGQSGERRVRAVRSCGKCAIVSPPPLVCPAMSNCSFSLLRIILFPFLHLHFHLTILTVDERRATHLEWDSSNQLTFSGTFTASEDESRSSGFGEILKHHQIYI